MFFNSLSFIFGFLPIVVIGYFLIVQKWGKIGQIWLVAASLIFYFLLIPDYLPLLIVSILFNFSIGKLIIFSKKNSKIECYKKHILFAGILGDLCLLGFYKYFDFTILNINSLFGFTYPLQDIILPLGISFFTFTQLAFIADTYNGKVDRINILTYFQFVTFFPHLIAGPIYHHADIIPQFEDRSKYTLRWDHINLGMFFFFIGLAKKVLIADTLATIASPIFTAVMHGGTPMLIEAWLGALAYTLQIYFDFSGYIDMAVGIALLFNIRFPINFFSPYKVTSIIDFWRCWNITLSNWLRDYVYIPLGGNRHGLLAQLRNLMITMLVGGLWHGAGWTFVIWGGLHGVYLIVNHLWRRTKIVLHAYVCWAVTFVAVVIGWVFFRADSVGTAFTMLKGMGGGYGVSLPLFNANFLGLIDNGFLVHNGIITISQIDGYYATGVVLSALAIALILPNLYEMTNEYGPAIVNEKQYRIVKIDPLHLSFTYRQSIRWSLITGLIAAVAIIFLQNTSEFLYFRF